MTFRIIILPRAEFDIEANARWWAENHSVEQAFQWFSVVHEQLKSLSEFPESYPLSAENGDFPCELRDRFLGLGTSTSHRAIFTIKNNTVYILTVRHTSRDVVRLTDIEIPPAS